MQSIKVHLHFSHCKHGVYYIRTKLLYNIITAHSVWINGELSLVQSRYYHSDR